MLGYLHGVNNELGKAIDNGVVTMRRVVADKAPRAVALQNAGALEVMTLRPTRSPV